MGWRGCRGAPRRARVPAGKQERLSQNNVGQASCLSIDNPKPTIPQETGPA